MVTSRPHTHRSTGYRGGRCLHRNWRIKSDCANSFVCVLWFNGSHFSMGNDVNVLWKTKPLHKWEMLHRNWLWCVWMLSVCSFFDSLDCVSIFCSPHFRVRVRILFLSSTTSIKIMGFWRGGGLPENIWVFRGCLFHTQSWHCHLLTLNLFTCWMLQTGVFWAFHHNFPNLL